MTNKSRSDLPLILFTLAAALYGLLLISSAVKSSDSKMNIIVQAAAIVMGIAVMFVLRAWDYQALLTLSRVIFAVYVFMLILVLIIGTGRSETGTMGWISLGPVNIQPSEFAKIGYIITFASHLTALGEKMNKPSGLMQLALHALVPLALILMQPDYGTAMVFIFITIVMLFYAGLKLRYFVVGGTLFVLAAPILWFFVLDEFQKNRILVFLNPESSPMQAGYNVIQSKLAVGAGMVTGKGLFNGSQIQLGFLPGKHTDFIFAVAGEELGFIGCIAIIGILGFIIFKLIVSAGSVKKDEGAYILIGIAAMFIFQSFENIGMCIGLMPVTGIPLPFFSYGGSSVLTCFIAVGIALSIIKRSKYI